MPIFRTEYFHQNMMETPFFAAFPVGYRHLLGSESGQIFLDELTEDSFREFIWDCLTGLSPTTHFGLRFLSQRIAVLHHGIQQMFDLDQDYYNVELCIMIKDLRD